MSSTDFLSIRKLAGELLISQTRNQSRCFLTTRELVFQKPHVTYYLLLQDIVGLTPYPMNEPLIAPPSAEQDYYQITTQEISMITRSGVQTQQATKLILPIHHRILQQLIHHQAFIQVS